jgi:hypothetical protein
MGSQFWPFTGVLREIWPGVTRKVRFAKSNCYSVKQLKGSYGGLHDSPEMGARFIFPAYNHET